MPHYDWANGGSYDIFGDGEYSFSIVGADALLWNVCEIQKQNYGLLSPSPSSSVFNRKFTLLELKSKPTSSPSRERSLNAELRI